MVARSARILPGSSEAALTEANAAVIVTISDAVSPKARRSSASQPSRRDSTDQSGGVDAIVPPSAASALRFDVPLNERSVHYHSLRQHLSLKQQQGNAGSGHSQKQGLEAVGQPKQLTPEQMQSVLSDDSLGRNVHMVTPDELAKRFQLDRVTGLTSEQVQRDTVQLPNRLSRPQSVHIGWRLFIQLIQGFIIPLWVATLFAFLAYYAFNDPKKQRTSGWALCSSSTSHQRRVQLLPGDEEYTHRALVPGSAAIELHSRAGRKAAAGRHQRLGGGRPRQRQDGRASTCRPAAGRCGRPAAQQQRTHRRERTRAMHCEQQQHQIPRIVQCRLPLLSRCQRQ